MVKKEGKHTVSGIRELTFLLSESYNPVPDSLLENKIAVTPVNIGVQRFFLSRPIVFYSLPLLFSEFGI